MRFIGDVHGKFRQYKRLIKDVPASIQVGDFGVGFRRLTDGQERGNPPHAAMIAGNHRFIRGNHDNPGACRRHSQWIADGTIENGIMFVGGGVSVDREYRVENFSWWPDEELSISELNTLVDVYKTARPRVMVTHDCPESIAHVMSWASGRNYKLDWPSRSRQAFEAMLYFHQPELWVFGHWHVSLDRKDSGTGTRFICLAELEHKDIEL